MLPVHSVRTTETAADLKRWILRSPTYLRKPVGSTNLFLKKSQQSLKLIIAHESK